MTGHLQINAIASKLEIVDSAHNFGNLISNLCGSEVTTSDTPNLRLLPKYVSSLRPAPGASCSFWKL